MAFIFNCDLAADPTREGVVLTFILPASKCNLSCPACVIRQRKEIEGTILEIKDYISFIESARKKVNVSHVAIQGYEPLLPESWPFASSIIDYANKSAINVSLLTNGIFLDRFIDDLSSFSIKKLAVSLDSPDSAWHDSKRGMRHAFDITANNIAIAAGTEGLAESLWVTSVLYPGQGHVLYSMPEYLKSMNIKYWAVNPLFRIGNNARKAYVDIGFEELSETISILYKNSSEHGIVFRVDDEFSMFRNDLSTLPTHCYQTVEHIENVIRLTPSGFCSVGREIMNSVTDKTPKWIPHLEDSNAFFDKLPIAS